MNDKAKLHRLVMVAVFAAVVFASNYIRIPIPVAIGDVTAIHVANGVCILSGLLLGPVGGGLAAGIGSAIFDITNPLYIASAPYTLVFKFILAALPGLVFVKFSFIKNILAKIIVGGIAGQIAYIILYLSKTYIQGLLEGNAPGALIPVIFAKLGSSVINAIIGVVIACVLYGALKPAFDALAKKYNVKTILA